jgi:hypothetical protein
MKKLATTGNRGVPMATFLLCHFCPEDGDSMFLQNIGICPQNYTAKNPIGCLLKHRKAAVFPLFLDHAHVKLGNKYHF